MIILILHKVTIF